MLDIRSSTYHLFVIICLVVQPKAFGMFLGPAINSAKEKNKLPRRHANRLLLQRSSVISTLKIRVIVRTVMKS